MQYRREIDGLRAIAVLPVILFHAGFSVFSGGYLGVDVFFVISGYLITTIIVSQIAQGSFSIVDFYERRARRILPALYFVMLVCLPLAYAWMLPSQLKDFAQSLIAVVLFSSNWLFWRESGYFAAEAELKPLLHTWSLAVEEQYYLFFPVLLLLLWRFGKRRIFWIILILALLSFTLAEWGWRNNKVAQFYLTPMRVWELFVGSLCALLMFGKPLRSSNVYSVIGIAMIVVPIFIYDANTPFPSVYTLIPVVGAALVIMFASPVTWVGKLLSFRVFVGIGLTSYSAYLWHQPLFAFARIRSDSEPHHLLMGSLAIGSLLLAWATWCFVEQPFRKQHRSSITSRRAVFVAAAALGAFFAILGVLGTLNDGFKWRYTPSTHFVGDYGHLEFHQVLDQRFVDCEPDTVAKNALTWEGYLRCKQTKPGAAEIVLLGDSHAEHLFLGLAESLPHHNVAFFIHNGSPFLSVPDFDPVFTELLEAEKPKIILIAMHHERFKSSEPARSHFEFELERSISALEEAGNNIILLQDTPDFEYEPEECLLTERIGACEKSYLQHSEEVGEYEAMLNRISKRKQLPLWSLSGQLCKSDTCSMFIGTTLLYRDRNHLNLQGSRLIGNYLAQKLNGHIQVEKQTAN